MEIILLSIYFGVLLLYIYFGVLIAYIVALIIIFYLIVGLTKNRSWAGWITCIAAIYPLASCIVQDKREKEERVKFKQEMVEEAHRRRNNLLQACKTESKMTVYQKIPAQSGIFIEGEEIDRFKNVIPTRFVSEKERAEMTWQLSELQKQCQYDEYNCRAQYKVPISWAVQSLHEPDIMKMSNAAFLQKISYRTASSNEWLKKYEAYLDKEQKVNTYGEVIIDSLRGLGVNGTKKWWRQSGLEHVAKLSDSQYDERQDNDIIDIRSFRIYAPYRLARYDVSTVADRQKGIRRGRIALEEISSNRVLSEYIGFEVVPYVNVHNPRQSGSLNCFSDDKNWNEYMKYGDSYRALSSSDEDIVFEHFFNHAVDKTRKAKIEKNVYP